MLILIPILVFFLLFRFLRRSFSQDEGTLLSDLLTTAIIFGALLVFSTESLSLFSFLNRMSLTVFWIGCGVLLIFGFGKEISLASYPVVKSPPLEVKDKMLLGGAGVLILLIGLTALVAPPNNWDSMTYHMSRVAHWAQNASVHHYPTNNIRQLTYAPLSEYFILQAQILSGSDRFANLIQGLFMLLSILATVLIAQEMGCDVRGKVLTAVLTATIPMGILQASSTQNDYAVSFYLASLFYFFLKTIRDAKGAHIVMTGLSAGLLFLTKGTGYVFALPIFAAFFFVKKHPFIKRIQIFIFGVLIALLFNAGFYLRTFDLNGSLFPSHESPDVINDTLGLRLFLSVTVKNTALQLSTPFQGLNSLVESFVYKFHTLLGIDIADPRINLGEEGFHFPGHPFHEDHSGNFLYVLVLLSCSVLLPFLQSSARKKGMLYFLLLLLQFSLFNLGLKWQPWNTRLLLPLLILSAPFAAFVLSNRLNRNVTTVLGFILILCALPWVMTNQSRSLLGEKSILKLPRIDIMFINRPSLQKPYQDTVNYLSCRGNFGLSCMTAHPEVRRAKDTTQPPCQDIGLDIGMDEWEYPFWVLLKQYKGNKFTVHHTHVDNISSKFLKKQMPCAVISFRPPFENTRVIEGRIFIRTRTFQFIHIYVEDTKGVLALGNLEEHLYNTIQVVDKIESMKERLKKNETFTKEDYLHMTELYIEGLTEARLVDVNILNTDLFPAGDIFRDTLRAGFEIQVNAIRNGNPDEMRKGDHLFEYWQNWYRQTLDKIGIEDVEE